MLSMVQHFPFYYLFICSAAHTVFLNMQAKLNVGDIVECTIKRFVYFGIFVEVGLTIFSTLFHSVSAANCFFQRLKEFPH